MVITALKTATLRPRPDRLAVAAHLRELQRGVARAASSSRGSRTASSSRAARVSRRLRRARRLRDRADALPRPRRPAPQHRAHDRAARGHADPALRGVHDLQLVSTYRGVILIYAGLTVPFSIYLLTTFFRTDPGRAHRGRAGRRRVAPAHPLPDRAAALGPGARHARGRQRALGLERAADRARVPARRRAQDADGRRHRVPVPLQPRRARDHGRDAARVDPMVALYLVGQRFFIRGLTAGAVKGYSRRRHGRFDGKGVIVTGGGRGIGQATASASPPRARTSWWPGARPSRWPRPSR